MNDDDSFYKYKNLHKSCEHCGEAIESRPTHANIFIVLSGFEPMERRHIATKDSVCVITTKNTVKPYSSHGLKDRYYNAK